MEGLPAGVVRDLNNYTPLAPYPAGSKEHDNLLRHGLMLPPQTLTHDQVGDWLLEEMRNTTKASVVSAFLRGLALDSAPMRCGLAAYAYARHFKKHAFRKAHPQAESCAVCAAFPAETYDLTFLHSCRWTGSLIGSTPLMGKAALYLQAHRQAIGYSGGADAQTLERGKQRLMDMLALIGAAPGDETPRHLAKRLRTLQAPKLTTDAARSMIELLGYAGVLQPRDHPSWIATFIEGVPPSKRHSSDWAYPVDFWTGRDGVNADAVAFWFDDALEDPRQRGS